MKLALASKSGVAKPTIKRYIEYLESAFLIRVVKRIDQSGKRFQRQREFKVFLTNPSMRAALFSPIGADDEAMGGVVETAVYAQWFHSLREELHYARWSARQGDGNEVDLVYLDSLLDPAWAVEIKWSDRPARDTSRLAGLASFAQRHAGCELQATTRTVQAKVTLADRNCKLMPAAVYCYILGKNLIRARTAFDLGELIDDEA